MTRSILDTMTVPKWDKIRNALFKYEGRYTKDTLFSGKKLCAQGALWIGMGRRRDMLADRKNGATPNLLPNSAVCEIARYYGLSDSVVRRIPSANDDRAHSHNIPMGVFLWLCAKHGRLGIKNALAFRDMIEVYVRSYFWRCLLPDERKRVDLMEIKTKNLVEKLKKSDAGRFALKAIKFMVYTTTYGSNTGWRKVLRQAYIEMMIPDLVPRYAEEARAIAGVSHFWRNGYISRAQSLRFSGLMKAV